MIYEILFLFYNHFRGQRYVVCQHFAVKHISCMPAAIHIKFLLVDYKGI